MKTSLLSRSTGVRVPAHWPAAVHPQILAQVDHPTPYLMCDLETVRGRLRRLRTPLSRKFGAEAGTARHLMVLARSLGLRPYGVTFHVGSQCATPLAWRQAIAAAGRLLAELSDDGIELEMLNLGGGFPARYVDDVP